MKINILAFGIAKDIFGSSVLELAVRDNATIGDVKGVCEQQYPRLKALASYLIAVNNEYAEDNLAITDKDEIAIIPPVSGG